MNKIILVGRLTRDPEMKVSNDGLTDFVTFTLAISRPQRNKNNISSDNGIETESAARDADFVPIVAFGKTANYIHDKAFKGSLVSVSGRLRIDNYTDKNGDRRYFTEVIADEFHTVSLKKTETDEEAM